MTRMTTSSLSTYRNITSQHSSGRAGCGVCKITPHYMAASWSGRHCADYFATTARKASSNYCIGVDGDIAQSVDEDDRAWTSSSAWNDRRAITIECANVDNATGEMTQATWSALVALCADVCRRYGFRLSYTGDSSGSLTEHRMYAATACPGQWLHERMGQLADAVNAVLDGGEAPAAQAASTNGSGMPDGAVDFPQDPLLYDGSFGPATTKQVQLCLRVHGLYTGLIDGSFGPMSKKGFQRYLANLGYYSGLIDGSFGPMSVKALQQHLRDVGTYWEAGYGWCEIDGSWGPLTTIGLQRAINGNRL